MSCSPSPAPLRCCSAAGHQQSKQVFRVNKTAPIPRLPVFQHRDKKDGPCTLPCGVPRPLPSTPCPSPIDSLCSLLTRCSSDEPALPLINVCGCDGGVPPRRGRMWEPSYLQSKPPTPSTPSLDPPRCVLHHQLRVLSAAERSVCELRVSPGVGQAYLCPGGDRSKRTAAYGDDTTRTRLSSGGGCLARRTALPVIFPFMPPPLFSCKIWKKSAFTTRLPSK